MSPTEIHLALTTKRYSLKSILGILKTKGLRQKFNECKRL